MIRRALQGEDHGAESGDDWGGTGSEKKEGDHDSKGDDDADGNDDQDNEDGDKKGVAGAHRVVVGVTKAHIVDAPRTRIMLHFARLS